MMNIEWLILNDEYSKYYLCTYYSCTIQLNMDILLSMFHILLSMDSNMDILLSMFSLENVYWFKKKGEDKITAILFAPGISLRP